MGRLSLIIPMEGGGDDAHHWPPGVHSFDPRPLFPGAGVDWIDNHQFQAVLGAVLAVVVWVWLARRHSTVPGKRQFAGETLYNLVRNGIARDVLGPEYRRFLPFLLAAPVLFLLGAALVYYVMLPFVMWFSLSQQIIGEGVAAELLPKVSDYLNLVTALILAFGLCFQLPVVMTLLGLAGLINSKLMAQSRRYAIVAVVVVAAVVTPPDPISQLMLAVPMVLLYEVSIWCVRIIELRRKKADAAEELAS